MKSGFSILITILLLIGLTVGCGSDDKVVDTQNNNPDGRLYVLNQDDATLYIYDSRTLARLDSVSTIVTKPHYIEFSPDRANYYIVTLETPGRLAKYNSITNSLIDSVTLPGAIRPSAIAISSDGQFGYVCDFSGVSSFVTSITKYRLSDFTIVGNPIQAGGSTHDIKITSDGATVIACNRFGDNVTFVSTNTDNAQPVSVDPSNAAPPLSNHNYGPFGVQIGNKDSLVFIACMDSRDIRVIDIASKQLVDSISIPVDSLGFLWGPTLMTSSISDDTLFVTTRLGNSVVAVRVSDGTLLADIPVSTPGPFGITRSSDGSRIYFACTNIPGQTGRVYILDGNSLVKIDSLDVGGGSFGIIWQPPIS